MPNVNMFEFDVPVSLGFEVDPNILGVDSVVNVEVVLLPKTGVTDDLKSVGVADGPPKGIGVAVDGCNGGLNKDVTLLSVFPNTGIFVSGEPKIGLFSVFPNIGTLFSGIAKVEDLFVLVAPNAGCLLSSVEVCPNVVVFVSLLNNDGELEIFENNVFPEGALGNVPKVLVIEDPSLVLLSPNVKVLVKLAVGADVDI